MKVYGISDRGAVRSENQDRFLYKLDEETGIALLVLCDGMGGAVSGGLAAEIAANAFLTHAGLCLAEKEQPEASVIVKESAVYANIRVYDRAMTDENCIGMGTTLVGALVRGGEAALVNIGDSRGYLFAGGTLTQVTRDHSLVEELVARHAITPEEARTHPRRNIITRAVGLEYKVRCDVFRPTLGEGDALLLCSDGLSNALEPAELAAALREAPEPEAACKRLIRRALDAGAADNVSALILRR